MKTTRQQLRQIIQEELKLNQGQMIDIIARFDAEDSESVNKGEVIDLLSSMPDDDRNEFIRVAISSNDPDIDVASGDLDDYTTESIVDLVGEGTLRFDTQSLASWMEQTASRIGGSTEDISGKIRTRSSSGSSDTSRGQVAVILGRGTACSTHKSLSADQVIDTFNSKEYISKDYDSEKLVMISCYATGGTIMSSYDLAGIIEDPESNPDAAKKLRGLGKGIIGWILKNQSQTMRESKMKITRRQLRQIIQEELSKSAPFGSGMKQAKLDKDEKDLIGHT